MEAVSRVECKEFHGFFLSSVLPTNSDRMKTEEKQESGWLIWTMVRRRWTLSHAKDMDLMGSNS